MWLRPPVNPFKDLALPPHCTFKKVSNTVIIRKFSKI